MNVPVLRVKKVKYPEKKAAEHKRTQLSKKISEFRGSRVFPPRVNLRYKKRVGKTINLRHTIVPPTNITPPKNQHFQILTGSHSLGCRILHVR